ncbi:hypothetical protein HD554DRAFT_1611545 [Boletus coccyginus]|nr:hypothetical protein HD554DRAFT_1611545 [Boletus coccyginus]
MPTPAEIQFHTSSKFKLPSWYNERKAWKIKNDYPRSSDAAPHDSKPWLDVNFKTPDGAEKYCNLVKQYIFEGNTKNDFIVQHNDVRKWFHAPWLHYGDRGREPINGLVFGGFLEPGYLAKKQSKYTQGWLCSYFNWEAATILGDMWADPNNPKWDNHLKFPPGSVICENIFCDIEDEEVPIAKGSPEVYACIGKLPDDPSKAETPLRPDGEGIYTRLRLLQVDFAARDCRSPIGWVFGTFACDGRKGATDPWDNVFPIGVQYGNDPDVLQKEYDQGRRPMQLWKNPAAFDLLKELEGNRPWLGWHERLDGLADDFMGTCTSCHATAQLSPASRTRTPMIQDPKPQKDEKGNWVQKYEEVERKWFRNLPSGTPFDDDSFSADYNMHVEFAYTNYRNWKAKGEDK